MWSKAIALPTLKQGYHKANHPKSNGFDKKKFMMSSQTKIKGINVNTYTC